MSLHSFSAAPIYGKSLTDTEPNTEPEHRTLTPKPNT